MILNISQTEGGKELRKRECTAFPLRMACHKINIINWLNGFDTRSNILTEYILYSNVNDTVDLKRQSSYPYLNPGYSVRVCKIFVHPSEIIKKH